MIVDFESRLAEVLGARLPVPFRGHVAVGPSAPPGADPQIVVGVREIVLSEPDMGCRRSEVVPGATDPRRVVRLDCTVGLEIHPANSAGRNQQVAALDAALYELDAPDFRDGSALNDGTDRGFLIDVLQPMSGEAPLSPAAANAPVFGLTLVATGLFWPAGTPGQAGKTIGEVQIRGAVLPVEVNPAHPDLVAGGAPVALTFRVRRLGASKVGGAPGALSFGSLALTLFSAGGKPGKGTLSGGAAGAAPGVRMVPVTNGEASVTYTPPADAATDELAVALDNGAGDLGVAIGRVTLHVRGA